MDQLSLVHETISLKLRQNYKHELIHCEPVIMCTKHCVIVFSDQRAASYSHIIKPMQLYSR